MKAEVSNSGLAYLIYIPINEGPHTLVDSVHRTLESAKERESFLINSLDIRDVRIECRLLY